MSALPTLKRGDVGPAVATLQRALGVAADGAFGPATEGAVRAKQRVLGLAADGIVGPGTWAALGVTEIEAPALAPGQVPLARTVIDAPTYARAVLAAAAALGWPQPSKAAVGVLYAQFMVETGGRSCWLWNIGNVKVTQGQIDAGVPWFDLPGTWEIVRGKKEILPEGHPGRRFRAYGSLSEAMPAHLRLLRERKYASAWRFVEAGDPVGMAHALKAGPDRIEGTRDDYFTGNVEQYAAGMLAHFRAFMRWDVYEAVTREAPLDWPVVELDGVRWAVAPIYIWPIGIGAAVDMAAALGCELPSPRLVDAIWRAADVQIDASQMVRTDHDGTPATMASLATYDDQAARLERLVAGRSYRLLAGYAKDVVAEAGQVGLYGWHRADGRVIQPFYAGHARAWIDYSQGLRLCRRT